MKLKKRSLNGTKRNCVMAPKRNPQLSRTRLNLSLKRSQSQAIKSHHCSRQIAPPHYTVLTHRLPGGVNGRDFARIDRLHILRRHSEQGQKRNFIRSLMRRDNHEAQPRDQATIRSTLPLRRSNPASAPAPTPKSRMTCMTSQ